MGPSRWIGCLLALMLTGCQLRLGVDVAVRPRGDGTLAVTLGADEALLRRAEQAGADPLAALVRRTEPLASAGWRVQEETGAGGGRQVRLSAAFADPDEFNRLAADLAHALAGPEVTLLEPITLTVTEDRMLIAGRAGLVPTAAGQGVGGSPPAGQGVGGRPPAGQDAVALAAGDALVYEVTVRLPGEVLETTAPTRRDGRLVWRIAPGGQVSLETVAVRPRRPAVALPLALALALGGTAVAVAAVRRRRARGRTAA